jgi:hypothetical protein
MVSSVITPPRAEVGHLKKTAIQLFLESLLSITPFCFTRMKRPDGDFQRHGNFYTMRSHLCQGKKDKEFKIIMSNNYARHQILLIYRNFPATIHAGVAIEQQCVKQEHSA